MISVLLRRFFSKEPHKRLPISKTISKNFLDNFLDRAMLYGIRLFGGSNIKNAENPCKHWGFSVFYRLLSSRKIRHFPTGYCALKTVWGQPHGGSNPSASAKIAAKNRV